MTQPASSSIANPGNYLRTSRNFPSDIQGLQVELSKSYVDIANQVNNRISGIYGVSTPTVTGESWFISGEVGRQQTLRQLYPFTAAGNIAHGINWTSVSLISPRSYGSYTDGTNWYGTIYASSVAIAGQVSFYVTPTNIVVVADAGAPAFVAGVIILEWLSQF